MNIKEWILPLSFAIIMTYAVQYFLEPKLDQAPTAGSIKSGAQYLAPTIEDINKPLNTTISYAHESDQDIQLQSITTKSGAYVFSNKGAILQSFSFPWQKENDNIHTLLADERCFFVAFDHDTPVMYTMTQVTGDDSSDRTIEYTANFDGGKITKLFTVHHYSYQIDLDVTVTYHHGHVAKPVQLRIVLPQPVMQPAINLDKVTGFVNDGSSLTTIDLHKKDTLQRFWALPTCFGYESRFLIHALIKDESNIVQRAYMTKSVSGNMVAFLESRVFTQSNSWKTKYFVGPKAAETINKVDKRLLKTLNFGWLSPISHAMLSFLKYLYEKIGNYGWAIILLTLLLKLLLLPFTWYGEKNMRKGADMQQKLSYLQKKYKDNPEALDKARAELIQKHGVPGLAGCLPLLFTLPILIGLNTVLSNAIELYGANFLWIKNLYAVDPYYILPVLTGLAMLLMPVDTDPRKGLMRYAMALMMATIACYLSAGLVLFILVNSLVGAFQTTLQKGA